MEWSRAPTIGDDRATTRRARAWLTGHALAALCGLLLACTAGAGWIAHAAAGSPPGPDVRLGFDGAVKIGVPLPMDVRLPPLAVAGPARLVVEAPALGPRVGVVVTSTVASFDAVPGVAREVHVPVVVRDIRRPLTVRVLVRGREVLRRSLDVDPARVGGRLIAVLSREPPALPSLRRLPGRVVVASVEPETLPRAFQEYEGIDLLVVRDLDQGRLDEAQRAAILTWLRLGGRLLVVPQPGIPVPLFLDAVLPASVGAARAVAASGPLALAAAGPLPRLPAGPYPVTALTPRPGADTVLAGGIPLAAGAEVGLGYVTVWAVDPDAPPLVSWSGGPSLWAAALGTSGSPAVDVAAAAGHLPQDTPLDPVVHIEVGIAILLYVATLYVVGRRHPSVLGIAASVAIACAGIGVFTALAQDARGRATVLTQATFLEQSPGAGMARAVTIAAIAVPYGGRFQIRAPAGSVATPVGNAGDVQVELGAGAGEGALLVGRVRPGEGNRTVYAIGAVPLSISGTLADGGRMLRLDLAADRLSRAEVLWAGRVYHLGTLPSGTSTRRLVPDRWKPLGEADDDVRPGERLFRGQAADAIVESRTPVLVGELARGAPGFTPVGRGSLGPHLTILVMPLAP